MSTFLTTTSTSRPSSPTSGDVYFETDTKNIIIWDGTIWRGFDSSLSNSLAADFSGTDDYLNCGTDSELNLTSGFTYSFWVYPTSTTNYNVYLARSDSSNGFQIFSASLNSNIDFGTRSGGTFTSHTFSGIDRVANQWQHYAFTYDGTTLRAYRNGIASSSTFTGLSSELGSLTSGSFIIGKHPTLTTGGYHLEGLMDEVAVWSSALSASEVLALSQNPHPLLSDNGGYNSSSDLIAWWRMGDGSGDTDSGSGAPASGDTIGTVKNLANPGTHDGSAVNSPTYTGVVPN
jgi:hypothetical protein